MDPRLPILLGPNPEERMSKRSWESSVQAWRRLVTGAAAVFYPPGFNGYVVD
jgi:hypothetical protein